ncbi:PH domain-containing protein [Streptomyces sp. NPDC058301]|uniref:PH domain-containing protein n=1 Tax=Streptomyces sp. NPDC058301 TaxID=3346436 RepID=UPI0036E559A3
MQPLHEFVRALPVLMAMLVVGLSTGNGEQWSLLASVATILLGPVRWYTTAYRVTADQVQLRRGLLRREVTSVPRERVRSVDVTAHPLHRMLGLARVEIGTGSADRGAERRLRLDALSAADADRLRAELFRAGSARPEAGALVAFRPGWLRYAPLNVGGPVLLALLAALLHEMRLDPWHTAPAHALADRLSGSHPWSGVLEAALLAIASTMAASTLFYAVMFGNFRLSRLPDGTLRTAHGMLTTRTVTVEERRVHGIEIGRTLPVRALGGARCVAITTGVRPGRGGGALLVPSAPVDEVRRVARSVLGTADPVDCALAPRPRRALRRRLVRALLLGVTGAALFTAAVRWCAVPVWPWPAVALLLPLGAVAALDGYRALGHALTGPYVVGRSGVLVRRHWALSRRGVVGLRLRGSYFQRRAGLVTLIATTAAGRRRYDLPDLAVDEALRVARELVPGLLDPFLEPAPDKPAPTAQTSEARTGTSSAGAG